MLLPLLLAFATAAHADIRPEKVYVAENRKTQTYIKDGLITGGDSAIQDVVIKDIRRAKNPLFERIVIDLEGNQNGEPAAIPRPPFYQVAVTPDEHRLVVTIWGHPKLAFDAKKVTSLFKPSATVSSIEMLPKIESDSWTFALQIKPGESVEVFELSDPVRIILDTRGDIHAKHEVAEHVSTPKKKIVPANKIDQPDQTEESPQ
jgi:hypothetical protein